MATTANNPPQGTGLSPEAIDPAIVKLTQQLSKLRDDIVAGRHPRFKVPPHLSSSVLPSKPPVGPSNGSPASSKPNGVSSLTTATNFVSLPGLPSYSPSTNLTAHQETKAADNAPSSAAVPQIVNAVPSFAAPAVDVKQKRQNLERVLEEQIQQKRVLNRRKTCDQEIIADFDVADVLRKAHEIVQPLKRPVSNNADQAGSSSDSFDENTFYSSQMNDSTTTEEGEVNRNWRRSLRPCRFFRDGKPCPYGDKCTFSHDPAIARRPENEEIQRLDAHRAEESRVRRGATPTQPAKHIRPGNVPIIPPDNRPQDPSALRIAELEEQLRQMKEEQRIKTNGVVPRAIDRHERENGLARDERGRDRVRKENDVQASRDLGNGRVIRNRISSPHAPQPSRVSPLATAKVPQITHVQNRDDHRRVSQGSNIDVVGTGPSPNATLSSAKKRKRRNEHDDGSHNVAARREAIASPGIQIKEEPMSPLYNFHSGPAENRNDPVYIDVPPVRSQPKTVYYDGANEPNSSYRMPEQRPASPSVNAMGPRTAGYQTPQTNNQDLRRVVSTRQVRPPPMLEIYDGPRVDPQPRVARAASHVQASSQLDRNYYGSSAVHSQYEYRPQSPLIQRIPMSPPRGPSMAMGPPPSASSRRIVVDQHGNRFMEATVPTERAVSVMPAMTARSYANDVYVPEMPSARNATVQPGDYDMAAGNGSFQRRYDSPAADRNVQYVPQESGRKRRLIQVDQYGRYEEGEPYNQYVQTSPRYFGAEDQPNYAPYQGQDNMMRVPSARAQQPRMVSLGAPTGEHLPSPRNVRQVSLRPVDYGARPPPEMLPQATEDGRYLQYYPQEESGRYQNRY